MRWQLIVIVASVASACGSSSTGTGDGDGACDHALTTTACWTVATATELAPPTMTGFAGATFAGSAAYFAPYASATATSGAVRRFDTTFATGSGSGSAGSGSSATDAFTDPAAWSTFDTTSTAADAQGFTGAAFDGRYIYFVPDAVGATSSGTPPANGVIARYDTTAAFGDGSAWTTFDTHAELGGLAGFRGAGFDDRYLYFVGATGELARYDTTASFTTADSWLVIDVATITMMPSLAFAGAVFDGRFLYVIPSSDAAGSATTVVASLDTQAPDPTAATAWETFDTSLVGSVSEGFVGGAFDGHYVYLAPRAGGTFVQYDTTADLATAASWATYAEEPLDGGNPIAFASVAFDGRYIYYAPAGPTAGGLVARYDTTGDFTTKLAWSTFDTTTLDPTAADYFGTVFDGRYLYLEPATPGGAFARFDAVDPATTLALPGYHGSFF